jgi:ComF family protein
MIQLVLQLYEAAIKLTDSILDLLFPNFCVLCRELIYRKDLACNFCIDRFANLASKKLQNENSNLEVFSLFSYSQLTKNLVLSKFWQDTATLFKAGFALKKCSGFTQRIQNTGLEKWIIVPVPLHWTRQLKRGFNQAQVLASGFAEASRFEIENLLTRKRSTKYQFQTESKMARVENMAGAFELNTLRLIGRTKKYLQEKFAGCGIILIDDLLTSGATLLECQRVVKNQLKPTKIVALTLCRR